MDTSTGFGISNGPCGRSGPSSGPHHGSKSELLRTLVAASSAKTAGFGVPRSVPKWRAISVCDVATDSRRFPYPARPVAGRLTIPMNCDDD